MFKFNFFENQNETAVSENGKERSWIEAEKVNVTSENLREDQLNLNKNIYKYGDTEVKIFAESDVIDYLKEKGSFCALKAEMKHSDLIPAEYEGGLKIWECTIDLINYLEEQNIDFKNKKVLDLGCGCGIVGIYCILKGALVDFQDYNKEVIENITVPNIKLNVDQEILEQCNFYSGDWKTLKTLLENSSYDYILTSETIYNQENYEKLLNIFNEKLKSTGFVYLAAKTYYFGVGGGTREFEINISKYDSLKSNVCWKCKEGLQREILKIEKL